MKKLDGVKRGKRSMFRDGNEVEPRHHISKIHADHKVARAKRKRY